MNSPRYLIPGGALTVLIVLPFLVSPFHMDLAIRILILALLALSLDLLVGHAKMISLGHAAFFGIGAYTMALLVDKGGIAPLFAVPLSVLGAVVAAALVGFLAVRTWGIYFVLITLAFSQAFYYLVHDSTFTGGSDGVVLMERGSYDLFGIAILNLDNERQFYFFVLALIAAFIAFLYVLIRSPFGQIVKGIGLNAPRLESVGFDSKTYALTAFVIAGGGAGLAGYLFALHQMFADPTLLSWHMSGQILIMLVLGGSGTLVGPVLGAVLITLLEEYLGTYTSNWKFFLGIMLVLFVLRVRGGAWPWIAARAENLKRRDGEARP